MNSSKFLNELIMKNGLGLKLYKKYFFATFNTLLVQFLIGNSYANAVCDTEADKYCSLQDTPDYVCSARNTTIEELINGHLNSIEIQGSVSSYRQEMKRIQDDVDQRWRRFNYSPRELAGRAADKDLFYCLGEFSIGLYTQGVKKYIHGQTTKSSSNQSSSAGSSSQSNQKAYRQSANNQSSSTTSVSPNQTNQQTSSSSNDSNNDLNMKPEQAGLVNEASQTYATKTAAFEESHKGLRRTHNKEDEASRCLKMDGRQITNTCDFRVEYIFCAYNPSQKAFKAAFEMAAAFDCERRQMGMEGVRPKGKQAGTFTADAVYVFGCKNPSLPTGVTYERGRGLSGRCSE